MKNDMVKGEGMGRIKGRGGRSKGKWIEGEGMGGRSIVLLLVKINLTRNIC